MAWRRVSRTGRPVLALTAFAFLPACGGGGGGATPSGSGGPAPSGTVAPAPASGFNFTEISRLVGLVGGTGFRAETDAEFAAGGLAAVDYDADGDVDLYVHGKGAVPNLLFRNRGDGTYDEVAESAGLAMQNRGSGPTFGDIDGDDDLDLFVGGISGDPFYLMRNDDGRFVNVGPESGIVLRTPNTLSATFADHDRDGDLDLFLSHWNSTTLRDTETLWRNRGDGTFESYSVQSGIAAQLFKTTDDAFAAFTTDFTLTPNLSDIDNDGDLDLLMTGDFGTSQVYENDGDGTFTRITDRDVITDEYGMGASVGDYDNDGDMDWFVTSINGETLDGSFVGTGNRLYRNRGDGVFEDSTDEAGVVEGYWGWGSCFADFDNDGHLDIFHTNGWHLPGFETDPMLFYHANGDGTFTEKAAQVGLAEADFGRGVACFDADRDGDLDIALTNNSEHSLRFYRNNLRSTNHYLGVKLVSATGNTRAVGAWITLRAASGTQVREMRAGNNFTSQNPTEVHFGLAASTVADLEVRWPDGTVTTHPGIAADQVITLEQAAFSARLVVERGSGSGAYEVGTQVRISAEPQIGNHYFSHWSATGGALADARSAHTTFAMPSGGATVRANYVPGVAWTADVSVARRWSEVLLQAIREDYARPVVHARNLFHVSAAMWDAWAAWATYGDDTAAPWLLGGSRAGTRCPFDGAAPPADVLGARREALSFAAYRIIRARFRASPGASRIREDADTLMLALGYDPAQEDDDYANGAAALGNHIAGCYLAFGLNDGSNEAGDYANRAYQPVNPPLEPHKPGNPTIVDLNRWQPLRLLAFVDQAGNPVDSEPEFLGAEWGAVMPFALDEGRMAIRFRDGADYQVWADPGPPPTVDGTLADEYKWGFALVAQWSSHLDPGDGVTMDISPASIGNVTWYPDHFADYPDFFPLSGGDPGDGYEVNPATGEPYAPQRVPRGDYSRVLAEFWADGPESETPPGHWFVILNEVNEHELLERRMRGAGGELGQLEWDVKGYFALGGAMHDAAIAAWGLKGWYDYIRPISALRAMAERGQSSDPEQPSYHVDGIPLRDGRIELVGAGDPLVGADGEHEGKIKVFAWRGPDHVGEDGTAAGVDWILAENWWPYQRPSFVTPPFAGYVSGHSTYSRAAAEVLTELTGDPFFPGGKSGFAIRANEFLVFERGPSVDMTLEWATYRDASDQCSLSRIWGGIHPPADDIPGRLLGIEVGQRAFERAARFFAGEAAP